MFVCVRSGCWPDFQVISMPTSSPSRAAPNRGITPVHSLLGALAGGWIQRRSREGRGNVRKEGRKEVVGRRKWEEVCVLQLPPPPHCETCHSAGDGSFSVHAWGINLYQKEVDVGATGTTTRVGNKGVDLVLLLTDVRDRCCGQSHWLHKIKIDQSFFKTKIPALMITKAIMYRIRHTRFPVNCHQRKTSRIIME